LENYIQSHLNRWLFYGCYVGVTNYIISTETGPLFGLDVGNDYTSGFDISSWGEELRIKNGYE
jgi:hypothetical protein